MIKKLLPLLLLAIATFAQGPSVVTPSGGIIGANPGLTITNLAPSLIPWYFSTNCAGQTNCTQIKADAAILTDCTTANTSSTVTCPDAIFTAADAGKSAWATTLGTANQLQINATIVCPISTIATVNSPTSITLTAANDCTSTQSGTAAFFWGTKDGTTIANAMSANGGNFIFTSGNARVGGVSRILVDQPFGNTLATIKGSTNISPFITISGSTPTASSAYFLITPDFNWAGCTGNNGTISNVCFGAKSIAMNYLSFGGFGLNGTGSCTGAAGKTVVGPATLVSQNYGLNLNGICPGTQNLEGIELDGFDSTITWGGAVHVGAYSCVVGAISATSGFYNDCINDGSTVSGNGCAASTVNQCAGMWVKPGGQYQDFGSLWLENVVNQGNFQGRNTHFYGSSTFWSFINSNSGGVAKFYSDGDFFNESISPAVSTSFGILSDFGAQTFLHNSTVVAGSGGTIIQLANDGAAVTVFDQCGNTFSGSVTVFVNTGNAGNVEGTCSAGGTKLATSNVGLTSGWGTSSVASVGAFSDSHKGRFTITGAAGSASPTLTLTFPTAYPLVAPPSCTLFFTATNTGLTSVTTGTPTLTNVVFTFVGTPQAVTYQFDYECGP